MKGNKKGPENEGPKTGRGLGYCNGYDRTGFENGEAPMGMRRGGGNGRGFGRGFGRSMNGRGYGRGLQEEILQRLERLEKLLEKNPQSL